MRLTPKQGWDECLKIISNNVTQQQYKTWFAHTKCLAYENGTVTIQVPSPFVYEYLDEHYIDLLRATLSRVFGQGTKLMYKIIQDKAHGLTTDVESNPRGLQKVGTPTPQPATNTTPGSLAAVTPVQELDPHLNMRLTFENFIEGDSNKLPRTVGMSIAEHPEQVTFNPLFVYGHSGVGKTHLVHAIGTRLKQLHPEQRVLYISAHLFMVQYTDAVVKNRVNDFIRFYQTIDVLIVDDVQEFQGVKGTQNTFFHIFNHLHMNGKQIILTSDRPPIELKDMEERILTRFKWGLQCEIERPTQQLRYDILKSKMHADDLRMPDEVLTYISQNVEDSVRDLEGVVNALMAYSVCWGREIDLSLTQTVLHRSVKVERKPITIELIMDHVCEGFDVSREDLVKTCRKAALVQARQVAMYLARKHTDLSTNRIGSIMGGRTHATVLHSITQAKNQMQVDRKFNDRVAEIENNMMTNR